MVRKLASGKLSSSLSVTQAEAFNHYPSVDRFAQKEMFKFFEVCRPLGEKETFIKP
jgi:hypothetical protein